MSLEEFQNFVLEMQLNNEDLFGKIAQYKDPNKVIIFYDRGIMDSCAYVDKETIFKNMLQKKGLSFADVYSRYDAVLHLVTAADGAEEFYQCNDPSKEDVGNNAAPAYIKECRLQAGRELNRHRRSSEKHKKNEGTRSSGFGSVCLLS